ncbi:Cupin 2 conserved barrel domain protein [Flexistipes sinusarabici DSM 4947]|uniref:Cupin 2 conserved barrel domain protein n=1 Tax=Flexistipes sinusarabici (strain ATCC 49648 / DSM 4947 / MAS 10) TaxID=717231 RepID=F8E8G3_FLESM|nr:cupin domain-containing protein [Flexistipes sinusarabici]AEI14012.1 Cupin 2 conserved barrel domain protein [Flexistipes sinusarabici DSM 4947]
MLKLIKYSQAENYEPEKDWKRASLCNQEDISIEHFIKPPKHSSPRHKHPNAQVLYVLHGKLSVVDSNNNTEYVEEGDCIYIPGEESHIVTNELDEISSGLDIFVPGRSFDFWLKNKKGGNL